VLIRLWERDARSQGELSDATFRDRPTMSRIIDGMEARGLVERHIDAQDSRVRIVRLTRKGKALQRKLVPVAQDIVERMVAGIEEDALITTRVALRQMFANLAG
jgi:DNA-binding MarR family transcriptional regulator